MRNPTIAALSFVFLGHVLAVEAPAGSDCVDSVLTVATVDADLDSPFYRDTKTSLNWWIIESESGSLEDTMDGEIGQEDLLRIEHTANCTSSHQGDHTMEFCDAVREGESVLLTLSGGMPAYSSDLSITIEPDLKFRCSFSATYPGATKKLRWKITKKKIRLKSRNLAPGQRLFGWISVTFEETEISGGKPKSYTIEGYIKPVIQHKD